jgi:formylmethanofuran:tetrahydromethanopterin formyltransferase
MGKELMRSEEKRALVTAKLAEWLDIAYAGSHYLSGDTARRIMNGDEAQVSESGRPYEGSRGRPGLWQIMAPIIDSVSVNASLENTLRAYQGMVLTETTLQDIMTEMTNHIDGLSGVEQKKGPVSRAHRTAGAFGGIRQSDDWDSGE